VGWRLGDLAVTDFQDYVLLFLAVVAVGIVVLRLLGVPILPQFKKWRPHSEAREIRYSIGVNADGVTILDLREPEAVPRRLSWAEIDRLTLFKADLFVVDLICLHIESSAGTIELDEEMEGWNALMDALPHFLSGCKNVEQWFLDVAVPAFAPNLTEIYRRDPPLRV
jgi:hypothetical protein